MYHTNHHSCALLFATWTVLTIDSMGEIAAAMSYRSTHYASANDGADILRAAGVPFGRDGIDIVVIRSDYWADVWSAQEAMLADY